MTPRLMRRLLGQLARLGSGAAVFSAIVLLVSLAIPWAQSSQAPPAPTHNSFTPSSGRVGTLVTITGTGFTGATSVQFNGVKATTYAVDSSTQIGARVPSGAATGKISVTTSGGTTTRPE